MVDWFRRNTVTQRNGLISQNSVSDDLWFGISGASSGYDCGSL
ncbi:hypothetical protein NEIMUCOT_05199 [Neisseria mucosa ATCC 25996]|uniref:Uncharacterized protein n=1 Tax=Neisseria mucosa (strain ATCC 25996 / DSM 4631 / NCTC 10774 / M26) TaxID=546266 RepID=D2ZX50_NEIM2|nr:hypothetical protein NEIMUCOT_05199 [Neisseria mucosa ATCC 25996]